MRLKVTPEGRENVYLIDPEDLKPWLDDWFESHEYLHNFIANDNSPMIVGADWTRESFDPHLSGDVKWAVVTEDDGTVAGHRLICVDGNSPDRYMRYVFDVGKIGRDDLEVKP